MKKIIEKGNYIELKKGFRNAEINKLKKYNYKIRCDHCGCKYIFEYYDVFQNGVNRVVCPQCGFNNFFDIWFVHRHKKIG